MSAWRLFVAPVAVAGQTWAPGFAAVIAAGVATQPGSNAVVLPIQLASAAPTRAAFARGLREHVVHEDVPSPIDQAEEQQQEDRNHQGELDQCLAARGGSPARQFVLDHREALRAGGAGAGVILDRERHGDGMAPAPACPVL